jgi:23S rRNA (adenine2503-C2)-methyltransferase
MHEFRQFAQALEIMSDGRPFHRAVDVTVSCVSIVPKIYAFAEPDAGRILRSPRQNELRNKLMPVTTRWNIDELMTAAKAFERTRRGERFTFEYVLLGGVQRFHQAAFCIAETQSATNKDRLIPHISRAVGLSSPSGVDA